MNKEFLFIGIPKTGCGSVRKSELCDYKYHQKHHLARDIKDIHKFFSFSFIRNPYEKVLSSYFFYENKKSGLISETFEKFIKSYSISKKYGANGQTSSGRHFNFTQYDYVTLNNKIIVDFIGDFSKIEDEFVKLQKINGVNDDDIIKLGHHNKSKHEYWKNYYTDELSEIIYDIWKIDFDFFNFDKNSYKIKEK